jgi:hypothetical protein
MFGLVGAIAYQVGGAYAEHETFKKMCDELPKERADALRAERNARMESGLKFRQALEIANASRARNFWGN